MKEKLPVWTFASKEHVFTEVNHENQNNDPFHHQNANNNPSVCCACHTMGGGDCFDYWITSGVVDRYSQARKQGTVFTIRYLVKISKRDLLVPHLPKTKKILNCFNRKLFTLFSNNSTHSLF